MTTIFQKNRFKLLTNGAIVSDQFNTNCAEDLEAASATPTTLAPAAAQLPALVAPLLPVATHEPLLPVAAHEPLLSVAAHEPLLPMVAHEPLLSIAAHRPLLSMAAHEPLLPMAAHEPLLPVSTQELSSTTFTTGAGDVVDMVAVPDTLDATTIGATAIKSETRSQSVEQFDPVEQLDPVEPEIDIVINNVVCSFSLGCHLNLRQIALNGHNVEYRRESGMVTMKLRKPQITASVWSSGKITCTGATSEEEARAGARRIARVIQKLGFDAKFRKMRIVNVLGCCSMPFEIKINAFSQRFREADYEPELHPGVTYKVADLKATLKIFSTGSITVTAPSVPNVQLAIEHIYPLVAEFRKELSASAEEMRSRKRFLAQQRHEHQQELYQRYSDSQLQPPPDDTNIFCTKRKRLNSNNSCSSNDDEDKEVESIMC